MLKAPLLINVHYKTTHKAVFYLFRLGSRGPAGGLTRSLWEGGLKGLPRRFKGFKRTERGSRRPKRPKGGSKGSKGPPGWPKVAKSA